MLSREEHAVKRNALRWISIGAVVFFSVARSGWAQNDGGQSGQTSGAAATAPDGQDNPPANSSDNPPISGLDQPSLGARFPTRSFLVPGAHISEALDTNAGKAREVRPLLE